MSRAVKVFFLAAALLASGADDPDRDAGKKALAPLQSVVGQWRGVGQPRRGSTRGSWIESAEWIWQFDKAGAALMMTSSKGKYWKSARLRAAEKDSQYRLTLISPQGKEHTYVGGKDDSGRLVLTSTEKEPLKDTPDRVTLRFVAGGKRLIVLLERRSAGRRFARLAEVGYTRKGSRFGQGGRFVECVVTGGAGTIPVRFEGKTYYVCCSGCRDYFNDEPANVLAEYRARKAEEKKAKASD